MFNLIILVYIMIVAVFVFSCNWYLRKDAHMKRYYFKYLGFSIYKHRCLSINFHQSKYWHERKLYVNVFYFRFRIHLHWSVYHVCVGIINFVTILRFMLRLVFGILSSLLKELSWYCNWIEVKVNPVQKKQTFCRKIK